MHKRILFLISLCGVTASMQAATSKEFPLQPVHWIGKQVVELRGGERTRSVLESALKDGMNSLQLILGDQGMVTMMGDFHYPSCTQHCVRDVGSAYVRCEYCCWETGVACVEHDKDMRCDTCKKDKKRWKIRVLPSHSIESGSEGGLGVGFSRQPEVVYTGLSDAPRLPENCPFFLQGLIKYKE